MKNYTSLEAGKYLSQKSFTSYGEYVLPCQ